MVSGINLSDKRVDKLIRNSGFNPSEFKLYYSPIKMIWVDLVLLVFVSGIIFMIYEKVIELIIYLPAYLVIIYLLGAKLNNTIAVKNEFILIVNPNFPFTKLLIYNIKDINSIEVKHSPLRFLLWGFFISTGNNINIRSMGTNKKYYCTSLELNAYDENFTKLDLDDLITHLQRLGIYKM